MSSSTLSLKIIHRSFLIVILLSYLLLGGMHPQSEMLLSGFISILFAAHLLLFKTPLLNREFLIVASFIVFFSCYVLIQELIVLRSSLQLFDNPLSDLFILFACFYLSFAITQSDTQERKTLLCFFMYLGALLSACALAHWLQDNGRLFWTFEPTFATPSKRARWPLVNPNHLAAALLLPLSIAIYFILLELTPTKIKGAKKKKSHSYKRRIVDFYYRLEQNRSLLKLMLPTILSVLIITTIFATLSRNGIASLVLLSIVLSLNSNTNPQHKRKKGAPKKHLKLTAALLAVFALLYIAFMAVSPQGATLVEQRLSTKTWQRDSRLTLYAESAPLLKKRPFTGIGLGRWREEFKKIKSEELSQFDPRYLHSDPYQFLIEYGVIGTSVLLLFGYLLFRALSDAKRARPTIFKHRSLHLSAGLLVLVFFSFFDFPFHVFAIRITAMAALGCICAFSCSQDEAVVSMRESKSSVKPPTL